MIDKPIERRGSQTAPTSRRYPNVRGGTCEFCGLMDKDVEAIDQYKLCEHYRGKQLECSYCPPGKADEVTRRSVLKIYDHPNGQELVVVCDSYDCESKHQNRFLVNRP